jgi:hypothetical protein
VSITSNNFLDTDHLWTLSALLLLVNTRRDGEVYNPSTLQIVFSSPTINYSPLPKPPKSTPSKMQLTLLPLLFTLASATIKVQYYKDGGCTDYAIEFNPPNGGSCWDYEWGGIRSANIASCSGKNLCYCEFYSETNCNGGKWTAEYGHNNCASNWSGGGFKSMKCIE